MTLNRAHHVGRLSQKLTYCDLPHVRCCPLTRLPRAGRLVMTSSQRLVAKKNLSKPLASGYKPSEVERDWYPWWESHNFFQKNGQQEKFVMVLPPPNVTGSLHLGHALTCAIQDAIARWHQMQGHEVVWVPGCDHAGIATQVIVERYLWAKEGITKHQAGRERFVNEIWKWKDEKCAMIYDQMKRLGTSLDWNRAVFTMDAPMSEAVTEAFIQLYDSGLVYRKYALVNWCCNLQSAISDIEVEHLHLTGPTELKVPGYENPVTFGKMYDFAYKVSDSDEELVICTTRPETMLGDTAVMVHPEDSRYIHLHGKQVIHPFRNEMIPVIVDSQVDSQFGTGVVKVTPGHSHEDYSVGQKHGLRELTVFDEQGKLTDIVPKFENLPRFIARQEVIEALNELGLHRGYRAHPMMVPCCSRTGDIIEPMLKPQWFIRCSDMATEAINAVRKGDLQIHPESYRRVWYEWLESINDWCVSRQLWWGHQIPVYCVCSDNQEFWIAARSKEEAKRKIVEREGITELSISSVHQDEDVLDTWFSSALFPFAVFGWPQRTEDLQQFYPTTLMETGHDILFFWVARMVMLGMHLTREIPFKTVLLHGLLCDAHGHKMSKSRGNVIDPIDVIEGASLQVLNSRIKSSEANGILSSQEASQAVKGQASNFPNGIPECGTDALRFTLCSYNFKNQLLNVDVNRMEQSKFLGNKIWQTVRFLISAMEKIQNGTRCASHTQLAHRDELGVMDKWILSHLSRLVCGSNQHFEAYDLYLVTSGFVTFWYNHLCDTYLESIKPIMNWGSDVAKSSAVQTLWTCVDVGLHILSPFMPFLTEELYHRLPRDSQQLESIIQCDYPQAQQWLCWRDQGVEERVQSLLQVASAFRALKTTYNITHNKIQGSVVCSDRDLTIVLREDLEVVKTLGRIQSVMVIDGPAVPPTTAAVSTVSDSTAVYLHLKGVIDPKMELMRLRKKLSKLQKEENKLVGIVSSPGYTAKSPAHIQEAHHKKLISLRSELKQIKALIFSLEEM